MPVASAKWSSKTHNRNHTGGGITPPPAVKMKDWSTFTTDDVLAQFNDSEQSAYNTARGDTHDNSLAAIVSATAAQIRQAYRDGGRDVDDQSGTIPEGEKNRAVAIARWKFLLALPTGKSLAENRQTEAKAAEDYLLALSKREIKVSGGAELVSAAPRKYTRHTLNGI